MTVSLHVDAGTFQPYQGVTDYNKVSKIQRLDPKGAFLSLSLFQGVVHVHVEASIGTSRHSAFRPVQYSTTMYMHVFLPYL